MEGDHIIYDHLGFIVKNSEIKSNIYISKYYNPETCALLKKLESTHKLISLGELISNNYIKVSTGDEIGKMAYGTGDIPFIRTSDIINWELKTDPKQGVSEEIYNKYSKKQDVKPNDIFFVRDGTYLIGSSCIIPDSIPNILYQSHILKFRVSHNSPISAPLFLALLSTPIVQRQIRERQFTADIIDTIGNRFTELILPVPKDSKMCIKIEEKVISLTKNRDALREKLMQIPLWYQGIIPGISQEYKKQENNIELMGNPGFKIKCSEIRSNIFVPRYYNPIIDDELSKLSQTHDLISIGDLDKQGLLEMSTGIEVGKMAYGTGPIPFFRTSDISNWELKIDPKQSVSEALYKKLKDRQDVKANDIFVVRDGTYLVGSSCIITQYDGPLLYCAGIYKIRAKGLSPYLLLAALNCPIVKQQMRAKQFTRDIIDTLGKRILEIILPLPKDEEERKKISKITKETICERVRLRNEVSRIGLKVEEVIMGKCSSYS